MQLVYRRNIRAERSVLPEVFWHEPQNSIPRHSFGCRLCH